jgi:ubiquitin-small subunit ribosomal protein S27Ae
MAAPPAKKAAAPAKKGGGYSVGKLYEKQGGKLVAKNKTCPKCGPGMFMAHHKDRVYCGFCKYVEFTGKK